jgi:DNA-directed RNA polymerase subunit M/transcription elongation factor TFIIS
MTFDPSKPVPGNYTSKWAPALIGVCPKCRSSEIVYRVWESDDGAFEDTRFRCLDCAYDWWVDGSDA